MGFPKRWSGHHAFATCQHQHIDDKWNDHAMTARQMQKTRWLIARAERTKSRWKCQQRKWYSIQHASIWIPTMQMNQLPMPKSTQWGERTVEKRKSPDSNVNASTKKYHGCDDHAEDINKNKMSVFHWENSWTKTKFQKRLNNRHECENRSKKRMCNCFKTCCKM